ncbi:hypothetical protein [Plantibacter sp. Leaf314]|uniref:hypothetical protein n=1 Tax=Plantibacter sp. Leaf314 TaxID=1736333 RepID=UPI0012F7101E|nr:hypothetical protein [Plantibacter sp. Leaf314]
MDMTPDETTNDGPGGPPIAGGRARLGRRPVIAIVAAVVVQLGVMVFLFVSCAGWVGTVRQLPTSAPPTSGTPGLQADPREPRYDDQLPTRDAAFQSAGMALGRVAQLATGGVPFAFTPEASEAPCTSLSPSGRPTKLARMSAVIELPVGTSRAVFQDIVDRYAPPLALSDSSDEFRAELREPPSGQMRLSTQVQDDAIIVEREAGEGGDRLRITVENGCFLPPIE